MPPAIIAAGIGAAGSIGGSLLSRSSGGSTGTVLPTGFMQANKAMKTYVEMLKDQISKQYGLTTGAGTPQEMPWFKGFQEAIAKYGQNQDSELIRQAAARGITGNSLSTILSQSQEARNKGILGIINQAYQQAPEKLSQLGSQLSSIRSGTQMPQMQTTQGTNPLQSIMGALPMAGNIGLGIMGSNQNQQWLDMLKKFLGQGSTTNFGGTGYDASWG